MVAFVSLGGCGGEPDLSTFTSEPTDPALETPISATKLRSCLSSQAYPTKKTTNPADVRAGQDFQVEWLKNTGRIYVESSVADAKNKETTLHQERESGEKDTVSRVGNAVIVWKKVPREADVADVESCFTGQGLPPPE